MNLKPTFCNAHLLFVEERGMKMIWYGKYTNVNQCENDTLLMEYFFKATKYDQIGVIL